jgi:GDP/UDP-N,N'-diacetylbacillosamine 2-epimerase (hydrolysing)
MKIGILTSSRADFGIYLPLLKKLKNDPFFTVEIIAFGTHLSSTHGDTIKQIRAEGFEVKYTIKSLLLTDDPESISTAIGLTVVKFANFWELHSSAFDLIFCLGDRYEMFAAVSSGIPFNLSFAHLHGGETTVGAIDNVFRHSITVASKYHFVSTESYAKRVASIIGSSENIYYVGALSLDHLYSLPLLTPEEFQERWGVDLTKRTILTTFHPETVNTSDHQKQAQELIKFLKYSRDQVLVTMPNADTHGSYLRKLMVEELRGRDHVFLIENLGAQSYFTAMKYCAFLLGNSSSGIIEAASFGKYVINLGDRQQGRAVSDNVLQVPIDFGEILRAIKKIDVKGHFEGDNIYYKKQSAAHIIHILKRIASYEK